MERREFRTGRAERLPAAQKKKKSFSESALFTLGLAFTIVYFTGLAFFSGTAPKGEDGAVAVMAEQETGPEEKGVWDALEDALRAAFKGGGHE